MIKKNFLNLLTSNNLKLAGISASFFIFLWLCYLNVIGGVSSADDAFFALVARTLADGFGYAVPINSSHYYFFDPTITEGPALIVPVSMAINFFGNLDFVPGLLTLIISLLQFFLLYLFLSIKNGKVNTLFFIATFLLSTIYFSQNSFYYGTMLGEPVTLMFIVLGSVILSFKENYKYNIYLAGFLFSLACHTKLISLFAVCGILLSWFLLNISYEIFNEAFKKLMKIFLVILLSFALFEFYKLIILGYQEYISIAKKTIHVNKSMAVGSISIAERLSIFSRIINQVYLTPLVVFFLCNMFCFANYIKNKKDIIQSSNLKCSLFLFFGSNFYFIYVIFFSVLMPRYLWIGYYLLILSMFFILFTKHKSFTALIFSIFFGLMVNIYFFSNSSFSAVYSYENKNKVHENRLKIVEQINTYTSTPFLAEQWMSIYDLIYINNKKIEWAMNDSIRLYNGKNFIGVFNTNFSSKNLPFTLALQSTCTFLHPGFGQFRLYSCGAPFWKYYNSFSEKK